MEWTPTNGWRLSSIDLQQVVDCEVEARNTPCQRRHEGDPPVTPTDEIAILKHALNDHSPDWICQAMPGIKPAAIREVLETYGWPDTNKMRWGLDELSGDTTPRTKPTAVPSYRAPGRVVPPTNRVTPPTSAAGTVGLAAADTPVGWSAVLTRALNSKRAATRAEAARVEKRLQALADRLADDDKAEAAKLRAQHEKQKALDEVAEAKAAYEAALAKVRGTRTTTRTTATTVRVASAGGAARANKQDQLLAAHGITVKDIKTWAAANGVDCPTGGRFLPRHVIDAYEAAHPTTPQEKTA